MQRLVQKYRRKGILVDTNLLIGYLVGILSPSHLSNCRATKAFTAEDFDLLRTFLSYFEQVVTTPHILTEVSNLAGKLPETLQTDFRFVLRKAIEISSEVSLPSKTIANSSDFLRLGLTDTAVSMLAPGKYLVLTDDFALYGLLQKRKVDVINFNHIRTSSWT